MKKNFLIAFNNTHTVIHFEKKIKDNNKYDLKMILMPTPRSLSFSCGLCIKIENIEIENLMQIILEEKLLYKEVYEITEKGYNLI